MPLLRVAGHFRAAVYRGDQAVRLAGRSRYCNFCCMSACVRERASERVVDQQPASHCLALLLLLSTLFFPLCLVFSALCPCDSTSPKWPEYLAGQSEFGFVSWAEPVVSVDGRFAVDTCRTLFTCRKDSQVSWWREIWHGCTTILLLVYIILYCIVLHYKIIYHFQIEPE